MANSRDQLRAKVLGTRKQFRSEIVEWEGEKFEIRQPSVGQRGIILQRAKIQTGDAERMDFAQLQVWATIYCTYTPDGVPVFEEADADALLAMPAGSFVDEFSAVALRLMNVEAEAAGKNSEKTRNASSSSA